MSTPQQAMDFPHLDSSLVLIWSGSKAVWPAAGRATAYLTDKKTDAMRGHALFTMDWSAAKTFDSVDAAAAWLKAETAKRGSPYHGVTISTVAELVAARFPNA